MSQGQNSPWLWVVATILALGVSFLYRDDLLSWFTIIETGQAHSSHNHSESKTTNSIAIEPYQFSEQQLQGLRQTFHHTEQIRIDLSKDTTTHIPSVTEQIGTHVDGMQQNSLPDSLSAVIGDLLKSIEQLAKANNATEARKPYAALSKALFILATSDPRLQEGWHPFVCPMAKDFPKWFQAHESIENPYMGQSMLVCGTPSDWSSEQEPAPPPPDDDDVAHYTCPMHPSVKQHSMGTCPICKMDLTPVTHEDLRTGDILVDPVRRQRIGVRTQKVARQQMVRPIRAVGEVHWDESEIHDVTARVDGWVEELRVTRVGDSVMRNATLLRFYSPDLLATQRELLAAPAKSRLADAAIERLRLWGISSRTIREMLEEQSPRERTAIRSPISGIVIEKHVNEGAHVTAGALLYRIANPKKVWILADIFEQDLQYISVGQQVEISLTSNVNRTLTGKVAYIYPTVSSITRSGRIRIELGNTDGHLLPGMFANLSFEVDLGEHLTVPTDAVIYTGRRRLVFVDQGNDRLRPKEVKIGTQTKDQVAIVEGLNEDDIIVSSGVFLLAAESRIRSATKYWESNDAAQ